MGPTGSASLAREGSPALAACPALKQGMVFSKNYLPQQKVFLLCWTNSKEDIFRAWVELLSI